MGLFDMFHKTKEEKEAIRAEKEAKKAAHRAVFQRQKELDALQQACREGRISLAEFTKRTGEINYSYSLNQLPPALREVAQQSVQDKSKQTAYFLTTGI